MPLDQTKTNYCRVKELENELDSEQRRLSDASKNFRRAERGIKEYTFRQEEDRKNAERMQDLVDRLQQQVQYFSYTFSYTSLANGACERTMPQIVS